MSYIPALHRRTGYNVIQLPARGTAQRHSTAPAFNAGLERARQAFLAELHAVTLTAPEQAADDAEGMCSAIRQLVQLAAEARRSA